MSQKLFRLKMHLVWLVIAGLSLLTGPQPTNAAPLQENSCQVIANGAAAAPNANTPSVLQTNPDAPKLDPALEAALYNQLRAQAKQLSRHTLDPSRVALFGKVVGVTEGCFVIHTFEPVTAGKGMKILASESLSDVGLNSRIVMVAINAQSHLAVTGKTLTTLSVGTPVLVGGALSGNKLSATLVADLRLAKRHQPSADKARPATLPGTFQPVVSADSRQPMQTDNTSADVVVGPRTLDFRGTFGGPTFQFVSEPNVVIFDVLDVRVTFKRFTFNAVLGSGSYDFPFDFQASAPNLVVGQSSPFDLLVQPKAPAGNSVEAGLGLNAQLLFGVHTPIGCGFLSLQPCDFDSTVDLFSLGLLNAARGPAPMLGETLNVPAISCLQIVGIGIPILGDLKLDVCNDLKLRGAPFIAELRVTGGIITSAPSRLAFNGKNPITVFVTPLARQHFTLSLTNFSYTPRLDYGVFFRLAIDHVFSGDSSTFSVSSSDLHAIPQEGQPHWIDFPFPVSVLPHACTPHCQHGDQQTMGNSQ